MNPQKVPPKYLSFLQQNPKKIKIDATVKMNGYSLNMMKFTLTQVNSDTTDSTFNPMTASQ